MKYIKKVSTAPIPPVNGSVVDTFEVEDKVTNAPSVRAVEEALSTIVESGSNENGSWTKFSDGTMICTLNIRVTDQAINNAYGTLFQGNRVWYFPQFFSNIPTVVCGLFKWGNSASWGTISEPATTTYVGLRGIDVNSRASGTNCDISAIAIGKWK